MRCLKNLQRKLQNKIKESQYDTWSQLLNSQNPQSENKQ